METLKVGIREFREKLASYLLETNRRSTFWSVSEAESSRRLFVQRSSCDNQKAGAALVLLCDDQGARARVRPHQRPLKVSS